MDLISRRHVVGAAGAGIVSSAGPIFAQQQQSTSEALQNPAEKFPAPPFQRQNKERSGLASKMNPKPDHGEQSYKGSGRLAGRKALITDGDSGMGRAAAIAYAREGADVAINYYPTEEPDAQEVIELIKAEGRKALAIPGDLRDEALCRKLVDETLEGLGGLDILVNNAGRQQTRKSILEISSEEFDATMKTNIYAPFWIIKAALPHMPPGSAIIGTTSEQAYDPSPDLYDYAQTKAATMNYVKSLAKQLAPRGIRVNGVAPGPIWTPLQVSGGATMEKLEKFGGQTPLGRPASLPNWPQFMCSWLRPTQVMQRAKCTDRPPAADSLRGAAREMDGGGGSTSVHMCVFEGVYPEKCKIKLRAKRWSVGRS